jgi:hypothetical protein
MTKIHTGVTVLLHVNSSTERHGETNKYIFINSSVAKNKLYNLKVYEGKNTIISFLSIQLLLQSLHHNLHPDTVSNPQNISIISCNDKLLSSPPPPQNTSQIFIW